MGLDLAILTPENARSFEHALEVMYYEGETIPDSSGRLAAYAKEVYDAYRDAEWPFEGDPDLSEGFVMLYPAPDVWEDEVPKLVERAHA